MLNPFFFCCCIQASMSFFYPGVSQHWGLISSAVVYLSIEDLFLLPWCISALRPYSSAVVYLSIEALFLLPWCISALRPYFFCRGVSQHWGLILLPWCIWGLISSAVVYLRPYSSAVVYLRPYFFCRGVSEALFFCRGVSEALFLLPWCIWALRPYFFYRGVSQHWGLISSMVYSSRKAFASPWLYPVQRPIFHSVVFQYTSLYSTLSVSSTWVYI